MDQKKIGQFLKSLRKEKGITQEQLAEILGVTNRSISRWENGVNMPDFDLLILITEYFNVEIGEMLDGERKENIMNKDTLQKVADYNNTEKLTFSRRINFTFIAGLIAYIIYAVIDFQGLRSISIYSNIADFSLGFVFGVLIFGVIYSSRHSLRIMKFKMKFLNNK